MQMDIAIINSWLITFHQEKLKVIKNGGIGITDEIISFVGPMKNFDYKGSDRIIDGEKQVILPGLINAHVHTNSTLLKGLAQDVKEVEWMQKALGPLARHLKSEDKILGSKLGVLEGLRTGTTTFAEYTENVSELIENVYMPFKVRVVAAETINEVPSDRAGLKPRDLYEFDYEKGEAALKRNIELFKIFDNERVTCMYGPQALDMVSLDLLQEIFSFAFEEKSKIHMHVAQGGRERLQIQERYGKDFSTIKILKREGLLTPLLLAAHCHDTTPEERVHMKKQGVCMVSCQSSIANIDGIIPPLIAYLNIGGQAGIGTDQGPGVGHYNMFREMQVGSILGKTQLKDPTVLPAWQMFQLATLGGAQILGLSKQIGSLEVGKKADIITLDLNCLNLIPVSSKPIRNLLPNLIYSSSGYEVNNVIINGEPIILDSNFVDIDVDSIKKDSSARLETILKEAELDWRKAGSGLVKAVDNQLL
ncbi:MAG: amidohydrolase family protein [Candidatus Hodarchaeales archaeon]